jgi:hypothetical protein
MLMITKQTLKSLLSNRKKRIFYTLTIRLIKNQRNSLKRKKSKQVILRFQQKMKKKKKIIYNMYKKERK